MYKKIERYQDRIFIISLLTMVMIVALVFKKPVNNKVQDDRSFSSVEYNSSQSGIAKSSKL